MKLSRHHMCFTNRGLDEMDMEKKKALNDAKDEISGIAMAIAEKVVGRELSEADQSDLINAFIDGLGEQV